MEANEANTCALGCSLGREEAWIVCFTWNMGIKNEDKDL